MQVTIACHQCAEPKRPLTPCPACHASPLAEPELQAWRLTLHARHLARIKRTPQPAALPKREPREATPLRAVLVADGLPEVRASEHELAPIVPLNVENRIYLPGANVAGVIAPSGDVDYGIIGLKDPAKK